MLVDMEKKIHEQISPETWCKYWLYRDVDGYGCTDNHQNVVQACMVGWVMARYSDGEGAKLLEATGGGPGAFNDTHSFDEVKALLVKLDL